MNVIQQFEDRDAYVNYRIRQVAKLFWCVLILPALYWACMVHYGSSAEASSAGQFTYVVFAIAVVITTLSVSHRWFARIDLDEGSN